jgi:hypothetical protein
MMLHRTTDNLHGIFEFYFLRVRSITILFHRTPAKSTSSTVKVVMTTLTPIVSMETKLIVFFGKGPVTRIESSDDVRTLV